MTDDPPKRFREKKINEKSGKPNNERERNNGTETHLYHNTQDSGQVGAEQEAIDSQNKGRKGADLLQPTDFAVSSDGKNSNFQNVVANDRSINERQGLGDNFRCWFERVVLA